MKPLRFWLTRDDGGNEGIFSLFCSREDKPELVNRQWFVFGDGMLLMGGGCREPFQDAIALSVDLKPGTYFELIPSQPQGTES